jgi:hypothetical protein
MTLSSSLVAIGFASGTQVLAPLVSVVIPVIVILGIFTVVRLVDTGVENVAMKANIAHIRSYYRTLSPDAPSYFPPHSTGETDGTATPTSATRPPRTNRVRRTWMGSKGMFTMASMIAVPNSVVAGAGVALGVARLLSKPVGFIIGSTIVVVALGAFYWYQNLRYQAIP